jgi:hypothetical protein
MTFIAKIIDGCGGICNTEHALHLCRGQGVVTSGLGQIVKNFRFNRHSKYSIK